MADAALDRAMGVGPGELVGVLGRVRMRCTVRVALHGDGRHGDQRRVGETLLEIGVLRLPVGEPEPPPVVVDGDWHVVRVVERLLR